MAWGSCGKPPPPLPVRPSLALGLLLEHFITDVRRAQAGDPAWIARWMPRLEFTTYQGIGRKDTHKFM